MARNYPTHLLSIADNVKSPGIFITRLIEPRLVAKVSVKGKGKSNISIDFIEYFDEENINDIDSNEASIKKRLVDWYYNKRTEIEHPYYFPKQVLFSKLSQCNFFHNQEPYTFDNIIELIKICFKTKTDSLNKTNYSFNVPSLFEHISHIMGNPKQCRDNIVKDAFLKSGFNYSESGSDIFFNISKREYDIANSLTTERMRQMPYMAKGYYN